MPESGSMFCGMSSYDDMACWAGNIGAICFFTVNLPQIFLNFRRKSTKGFSVLSVIIRTVGISFFLVNGIMDGSTFPLMFSAALNFLENAIFLVQFALYDQSKTYLFPILTPVIAIVMDVIWPDSIDYTNWLNPATQIACHVPYVAVIIQTGTTRGVSLFGQHLNLLGSVLGMLMCSISCSCDTVGWLYYICPLFQACSVFLFALGYGEFRIFDPEAPPVRSESVPIVRGDVDHEDSELQSFVADDV